MYVCLCKAITESQISAAVDEGADSLVKLRKKIGVADSCGSCIETTESIIQKKTKENSKPSIYIPSVA